MFETLKNAWKLPDLKKRICYTLMIIVIFRFGAALPVPFLDASVMQGFGDGNLLGFFNLLTGGAFQNATLFALSISPYITSSIVVTMPLPSGRDITQTRRILTPGGTDFTVLEALNDLSRRCCADPIPLDELRREVAQITAETPKPLLVYLGSALAAGSCALFFGGSMTDGLVAALFGLVICRLQRHFGPQCPNRLVFNLLSALAVGISITLCAFFLPELHADKILIGDIMLLIPGLAMTNAVRDTMVGSPISGAMRLIETLLWAGALAMGFMSAFLLMGGIGL